MRVAGVVPAAGKGERLGGAVPKSLRVLGHQPLLRWAADALVPTCALVVIAGPPDSLDLVQAAVPYARVVAGGRTRSESVRACLADLPDDVEFVLVHDAARPLAPTPLGERVLTALRGGADAVVPVLPIADTIKRVDAHGRVVGTVDRAELRLVQTPQGFRRHVLEEAHRSGSDATDDAGLVEQLGVQVHTVAGDRAAEKITVEADLIALARLLVEVSDA